MSVWRTVRKVGLIANLRSKLLLGVSSNKIGAGIGRSGSQLQNTEPRVE